MEVVVVFSGGWQQCVEAVDSKQASKQTTSCLPPADIIISARARHRNRSGRLIEALNSREMKSWTGKPAREREMMLMLKRRRRSKGLIIIIIISGGYNNISL